MRKKYLIAAIILVGAAIILKLNIEFFVSLMPKCYIHERFGLYCPGCGATRATIELLRGNIWQAFKYNSGWVLLILIIIIAFIEKLFNKKILPRRLSFWVVFIIVLFSYYIFRNFEGALLLAPQV